jgi:uncharacterized protein YoxC
MREKDVARKKELMAQVVHVRLERAQMDKEAAALKQGASKTAEEIAAGSDKKVKATEDGGKRLLKAMKRIADDVERERKELEADLESYDEAGRALQDEWSDRQVDEMMRARDKQDEAWSQMMGEQRNRIGRLNTATAQQTEDEGGAAMYEAGYAVGGAFISGLDEALTEVENGGEFDVAQMIAAILPMAITAGLMIAGAPAPLAGLVGQAAGVMVKHSLNSNKKNSERLMGGKKRSSYHSGGWVDEPPRYHDGAWALGSDEQPAILQHGERVLSRNEVDNAGGPAAVDRMAQGGGPRAIVVQAFDALSFRDYVGGRGGEAITRAVVEGRGEAAMYLRRLGYGGG